MSNDLDNLGWGAAAVVTTLLGAVGTLYKKIEGQNAKAIADLEARLSKREAQGDECEKDRDQLRLEVNTLQNKVHNLECASHSPKPGTA
jgi:hypothetical protein